MRKIIWKAAGPGLITGALLGFARISGETAPLLFTAINNNGWSSVPVPDTGTTIRVVSTSAQNTFMQVHVNK